MQEEGQTEPIFERLRKWDGLDDAYRRACAARWREMFGDDDAAGWLRLTYKPEIAKLFADKGWTPQAVGDHRIEIDGVATSLLGHLVAGRISAADIQPRSEVSIRKSPSKANRTARWKANKAARENKG